MSTTFDVLPGSSRIPTFAELLPLATDFLHAFLARHSIAARPRIDVRLLTRDTNGPVPLAPAQALQWPQDTYAWFTVPVVAGGTDAYFLTEGDDWRASWEEELRDHPRLAPHTDAIRRALAVGHRWSFRRSAGQPLAIQLTYAFLAAAVARLTDGLVTSEDSAWEPHRLPASPDAITRFYFEPRHALDPRSRDQLQRNLVSLANELRAGPGRRGASE